MDPSFCVPIGAGGHQASFWYAADAGAQVSMGARFFPEPDCTGAAAYESLGAYPDSYGWHQQSGVLVAPAETQSALFSIDVGTGCASYGGCAVAANVDDLDVEDGLVATPVIRSLNPGSGLVGTVVDLGGVNFTGTTSVTFNGTPAAFTVTSDSDIRATVPDGATTGPVA